MDTPVQLDTLYFTAAEEKEIFVINDIEVGVSPSDIQLYDNNYVYEQTFVRTNSVFCYRSKYSETKVVLNFPFQITPQNLVASGEDLENNTYNCIRLLTELNSYPFCFIKSPRLKTYVSPSMVSTTDYLMFAVEELAVVQSAIASNMLLLEVTLVYFNHAPLTADFQFVSNKVVTKAGIFSTTEGTVKTERDYISYERPQVVSELASSDIWYEYIDPKVDKALNKLESTGMYDKMMNSKTTHAGLDVDIFIPMISTGIEHATKYMADDDGKLLAPDAKVVVTTDMAPMDDLDLPADIRATLDQNFEESRFEENVRRGMTGRKKIVDGKEVEATDINTKNEISNKEAAVKDASSSDGNTPRGYKQVFVQYSRASFAQLGLSVQKIEVRRKNILATQKIGAYKHPIVQFMGKMAARTTIQFVNNSDGVYSEYDEDSGIASFLTNAFQILDENRRLYPEAEAYNTLKIHSLASFLLNSESAVPNQNTLSASAESNGIETMIYNFAETNIEEIFNNNKLEASGAKSISKARSEVYGIILTWLKEFHRLVSKSNKEGIYHFANMDLDQNVVAASLDIYQDVVRVTLAAMRDLGLDQLPGDSAVIKTVTEQLSDGLISLEGANTMRQYSLISPKAKVVTSGLNLYVNASITPVDYFDPSYVIQKMTISNYHNWFSGYAINVIQARLDQMDGKQVNLTNVLPSLVPNTQFETLATTIIHKLGTTPESIPFSNSFSESQKFFIKNMIDTYLGSLYGQNLPDLVLEDLEDDYDVTKDVVIQSTDPFFFLDTQALIEDEMQAFFDGSYNEEQLNSKALEVNQDAEEVKQMSSIDIMLGANYRKIEEVDFNESDWASNTAETGVVTVWGGSVNLKPSKNVSEAIEYALSVYGMSGDEELRQYMYKTAQIESSLGTDLVNGSYKGLFQFGTGALDSVLRVNNKAYASKGYKNLSVKNAANIASKLWSDYSFLKDFKTSAVLFLDSLFLVHGGKKMHPRTGKFDMAYTYAGHQQGGGGQKNVGIYLKTGTSPAVTGESATNLKNNSSSTWASWYKHHSEWYAKLAPYAGAPGVEQAKKESVQSPKKQDALTKQTTTKSSPPFTSASARNGTLKTGQSVVGTVVNAVDGDTLDIQYLVDGKSIIQRIRVAGLDTPETKKNNSKYNPKTEKYGQQATAEIRKLVGQQVSVSITGVENDNPEYAVTDKTKVRLIGSVTKADKTNVGLDMIKKGLANVNTIFASNQQYAAALEEAQRSKKGMWAELPANKTGSTVQQPIRKTSTPEFTGETGNNFQPFANGQRFNINSPFTYGKPRQDIKRKSPHNGLDLGSPAGTTVIAAAAGTASFRVAGGYGYLVEIDHHNGFKTRYAHLSKSFIGKKPQRVTAHQPIGLSGGVKGVAGSGSSTGAHLHYEVHYKGKAIHPFTTKQTLDKYSEGTLAEGEFSTYAQTYENSGIYTPPSFNPRTGITEENTIYNEQYLAEAIIDNAKKYINTGMKVALPAIKVYIVIGNENDGLGLSSSLSGVQYYELTGVQSFRMVGNNDNNPIDVAVMSVINPSFMHTDSWTNQAPPGVDLTKIGSDLETQLLKSRMLLKVGTKLQVRLGYGNDPNELDIVFNGGIVEVTTNSSNQMMTLLLESYGRELLQEIINPTAPEESPQVSTTSIIGKALQSRSIDHFGATNNLLKWFFKEGGEDPEQRSLVPPIDITGRGGFFNLFSASTYSSRLYMNIFAPEIENIDNTYSSLLSSLIDGLGWSNKQMFPTFFIYQATPWDICKQMEYRHPGTIFKPLIFEDRVTPFYGIKEQMYFARDISTYTQMQVRSKLQDNIRDKQVQDYYSRRRERMKPVSNIHMISSSTNLISNGIQLNSQWKTSVNVSWFEDSDDFNQYWDWDTQKMDIDDNLLPWEIREKEIKMSGIHGKYSSFMYGTEALKKEAETMYGGSIIITGNPSVKAGDYVFIDDTENRISGLCLVRDCIHHFDPQVGFVTEITPGLYVEPAAFMYSSLWIKLMCTFKVGSSKIRLNTSSGYSSQYNLIKDYLDLMQQLVAAGDNPSLSNYDKEDALVFSLTYSTAITLSAYMGWSLSRFLGSNAAPIVNRKGLVRFSAATMRGLFSSGTNRVFNSALAKVKRIDQVAKTLSYANGKYTTTKSTVIASKAFQRVASSKPLSALKTMRRSWVYQLTAGFTKGTANLLFKGATRASMSLLHGFAASNPVTLLLDVALTLIASWAFAKVEENKLTRQPLMFFPLINHGKPYVAGMLGAVRNSWLESQKLELGKTANQVSKAAAVLEGNNTIKGKDTNPIVKLAAKKAKATSDAKSVSMFKKPVTQDITVDEAQKLFKEPKNTVKSPFTPK